MTKQIPAQFLVLVLTLLPVLGIAYEVTPGTAQSGQLLYRMAEGYRSAALLNTEVDLHISGLVARVRQKQEFRNASGGWIEGIYVFPLPDSAAVDHMRLWIGERYIEGEIREKEQAKKEYEQAKAEGKKTSLVQQQRANLFTTRVANIAPGETVIVEIEYLEDIRYEDGAFSIRYPMTLTPRFIPGAPLPDRQGSGWSPDTTIVEDASLITPPMTGSSRGHRVSLTAHIDAGMPLDRIKSRYHGVDVREQQGSYSVSFASTEVKMDHDFELAWWPSPSTAPRAMAFTETVGGEPHWLLMLMPPTAAIEGMRMPRDMILIIDTSGSMQGVSIRQAKSALTQSIDRLQPGDRFNVIEFNSTARTLFPASVEASSVNVAQARSFVSGLGANGGTNMYPALDMALRSPVTETHMRQVVFITDGAVGNEEHLFKLIEQRLGNTRLFTVGIGSAPNGWFMRKSAEMGRGSFTTISALNEVGEKMDALFRKIENPQVTSIRVDWPLMTDVDSYPTKVDDLYLGEPVVIKARTRQSFAPGDTVRISGDAVAGAWSHEFPLNGYRQSHGIGALWARARIESLEDAGRRGESVQLVREAIIETALNHHLVSKYTSLVAVDKTPVRPAAEHLNKNQVPNLMPYGQSANAIFGFPATATSARQRLLEGVLLLAAALLFASLRRTGRVRRPA